MKNQNKLTTHNISVKLKHARYLISDRKGDFAKRKIEENEHNLQIAYDLYSILHYKTNQFSISDNLKTIQIRDATVDERMVGQRFNLSSLDVLRIKRLYGCGELTNTLMVPQPE